MTRAVIEIPSDTHVWKAYYLGALVALKVPNLGIASELASFTRDDREALHTIGIMRDAKEGDRVYPALAWLRKQREGSDGRVSRGV